jgi:hypothetical protein
MSYVAQPKPYVGITGITTQWEINTITSKWLDDLIPLPSGYCFMNGVLVSSKTLHGQPSESKRYPPVDSVPDLMPNHPQVLNTVHYNISGLSQDPHLADNLGEQLEILVNRLPADAIQLNMRWPDVGQLQWFRDCNSQEIILQVGSKALSDCSGEEELVERLRQYEGIVERVLIDISGGTGRKLDVPATSKRLQALVQSNLDFLIGVAGGLAADSMYDLRQLLAVCPKLSWDAEGRLRGDSDEGLDMGSCFRYLTGSSRLAK